MTDTHLMKAASATAGAGIDSVRIIRAEVPQPGPGEVLVRLEAATLNFRDLLVLRGLVPGAKTPEYIPLSDGAGTVAAVGEGVARVKPGDRVSPLFAQGWLNGPKPTPAMLGGPVDGVAREFGVFDAESLCLIPSQIDTLSASAMPCAGLTAWNALFGARPLQAGEWVLLQGTGGVSLAALQWAKASGAKVVITSSSDDKLDRAVEMGADIAINYRKTPDWAKAAREALNGGLVDIVVDVVGEAQIEQSAAVVAPDGIIAAVGRLSGNASWGKEVGKTLVPIVVGNREQHEAMLAFAAEHSIQPVIGQVYGLKDLKDALAHMDSGDFFGKLALRL